MAWLAAAALLAGCAGCLRPVRAQAPAAAPAPSVPFANVAAAAGIRFDHHHPRSFLNILETTGSGCAFVDVDRDGFLDCLLLARDGAALYRSNRDGSFTDVTREAGLAPPGRWIAAAAGDYDNDGFPDLYLSGYGCACLLHNEPGPAPGQRRFRDVTAAAGLSVPQPPSVPEPLFGASAAWGDFDRDGLLDLYVTRYIRFGPGMREFCRASSGWQESCGPASYEPQRGVLYRNRGGGRFEDVTRRTGADRVHGKAWGVVFFDFDDDGWPDIYVANDEMPGDLLRNVEGRRFENVGAEAGVAMDTDGRVHGAMGVDAGDYDGDGRLDLVVTTFYNEPDSLYRNNDGRTFTDRAAPAGISVPTVRMVGWGTKFIDYDNDGWQDLFIVNGHATDTDRNPEIRPDLEQPMQLFRNAVSHFAPVPLGALAAPIVGRGAAFGDFDNDGFADALVMDMEGPALLLHNEEGRRQPRAHWLGLSLTGRLSNRDGLGAVVRVRAGGRTQVAQVQTCGSVFSSNDPRLRFGIGGASTADEVFIQWPGGTRDRLVNVAADRYVEVAEGSSPGVQPAPAGR